MALAVKCSADCISQLAWSYNEFGSPVCFPMYSIVQGAACCLSCVHACHCASEALVHGLLHCSFGANTDLPFSPMCGFASSSDAEPNATASSMTWNVHNV